MVTTEKQHWRVGELAGRAGVSVRALHHYDEIGLLSPSARSEAGYRLYSAEDVIRLQQIKSLRALGFSLTEIAALLEGGLPPEQVIELHVRNLKERIERERALCARLEMVADRLASAGTASADDLFYTMEMMTMVENSSKYYTPEQLEQLAQRRETVGEERIRQVEAEWPELIAEVRAAMERGDDPSSEQVQALARRWKGLIEEFTGGDAGITQSLGNMWASEPSLGEKSGIDQDMFAYIGRAMKGLPSDR
jgi:DNA-binding transcriptional MerR regulator